VTQVKTAPISSDFLLQGLRPRGGVITCVACGRWVGLGVTRNRAPGPLPRHLDCSPAAIAADEAQAAEQTRINEAICREVGLLD
jgi:hypothetical protein